MDGLVTKEEKVIRHRTCAVIQYAEYFHVSVSFFMFATIGRIRRSVRLSWKCGEKQTRRVHKSLKRSERSRAVSPRRQQPCTRTAGKCGARSNLRVALSSYSLDGVVVGRVQELNNREVTPLAVAQVGEHA